MIKLFIGGFPLDMSELEIVQLVALYAEVSTIKIVRDKKTKICKGYAFLELTDRAGAERAIEALNGTLLSGRELRLSIVEENAVKSAPIVSKPKRPRVHVNIGRR
jgi:RNA recognition motif-containing protein